MAERRSVKPRGAGSIPARPSSSCPSQAPRAYGSRTEIFGSWPCDNGSQLVSRTSRGGFDSPQGFHCLHTPPSGQEPGLQNRVAEFDPLSACQHVIAATPGRGRAAHNRAGEGSTPSAATNCRCSSAWESANNPSFTPCPRKRADEGWLSIPTTRTSVRIRPPAPHPYVNSRLLGRLPGDGGANPSGWTVTEAEAVEARGRDPRPSGCKSHRSLERFAYAAVAQLEVALFSESSQ